MEVMTDPSTSTALIHQTAQSPPRQPGSSSSPAHSAGEPAHPVLATRSATAGPPPPRSATPVRPAPPRQGDGAAPRRFEAPFLFTVSAGGGRGATLLADDNRQTQFYEYQAISVGAAASLPGAELSLSVGARLGGTYLQSANFESMVKARVNKEANSSLTERLLRHTAAQHPRDADYKARGLGVAFRRFLLGRGYRPASSGPTFLSDAKLAKGYNTTKLHLLAEELDRHSGHEVPAWQALIVSAYPAPADVVRHCVENQSPLPPETPINRCVPPVTAQGRGMRPYREITTPFGVTLGAAGPKGLDGFAQVLMGFEASVRHNYRQFNLHECRHAHEFLDPALLGTSRPRWHWCSRSINRSRAPTATPRACRRA